MPYEDAIITEYRKADAEKRLTLFLDYPSLRNRFIDVDRSETVYRAGEEEQVGIFKRMASWIRLESVY